MADSYFMRSTKERECMDCGKTIKKGEIYYNDTHKNKKSIYCVNCKKKPEHCRRTFNHDKMVKALLKKPLFKHEFEEKYNLTSSGNSNNLIRTIMAKDYTVNIFRWSRRSRYASKIGNSNEYRKGFQPNDFIIYYVEGTENLVVKRILEAFEFKEVRWKPLLQALYGIPIPTKFLGKNELTAWANDNVFKYIPNNRYLEEDEKEVIR